MLFSIFAVVVVALVAGSQLVRYIQFRKFIKDFSKDRNKEILSTKITINRYVQLLIPSIISVILFLYICLKPDSVEDPQSYLTFLIILFIVFTSNLVIGKMYQCIYYTEEGFLWDNSIVEFNKIKSLNCPKGKIAYSLLKNGDSVKLSRRQYMGLKELCDKKGIRVKIE